MIVDDRTAIIGSANINDRSFRGDRDSEIAIITDDTESIQTSMNGNPFAASKFAHSLRCSLWMEHLGLGENEFGKVVDPIKEENYQNWKSISHNNTKIYNEVFNGLVSDRYFLSKQCQQTVFF